MSYPFWFEGRVESTQYEGGRSFDGAIIRFYSRDGKKYSKRIILSQEAIKESSFSGVRCGDRALCLLPKDTLQLILFVWRVVGNRSRYIGNCIVVDMDTLP